MRFFRNLCLLCSAVLMTSTAWTQATTSLRGTVSDAQGGAIGGVALQLVGEQTGFKRSTLSDEAGTYQFVQVSPGAYILVGEKPGFAVVTQTGVSLVVNSNAHGDHIAGDAQLQNEMSRLSPVPSSTPQRTTDIKPTITK